MSDSTSALVIERSDRRFIRVFGRDPVKMMQGLITNDIASADESRAVYAGMLTPKGKLIGDMRVLRKGANVLIDADAGAIENITGNLKKYVPPLFAKAELLPDTVMIGVYGASAAAVIDRALGMTGLPAAEDGVLVAGDVRIVRTAYAGDGFDIIAPAGDLAQRLEAAGGTLAGLDTLERLRIEAGQPRWGAELDESVIPLEAGLRKRMISETKGCYTGQEIIIRILHRGHVNRELRGLLLGEAAPPASGTPIFNEAGKDIGKITSAVASPRFGQTIALGYARRELLLPGLVHVGTMEGPTARVVALPLGADQAEKL